MASNRTFVDFFSGIGLVRLGLGSGWTCELAVDHDPAKKCNYLSHFGPSPEYRCCGVEDLRAKDVPSVDLAAICFPCTDLSLAGQGAGLDNGPQSRSFWSVAQLLKTLSPRKRPRLIMIENVLGLFRRASGRDLVSIARALTKLGYGIDALVLDAKWFVPQSRPRIYLIAEKDASTRRVAEHTLLRPTGLMQVIDRSSDINWSLIDLPKVASKRKALRDVLDLRLSQSAWWSIERRDYLLSQMWPKQRAKLQSEKKSRTYKVYTAYRRMREWQDGSIRSTAELRTDGVAGCLRTPKGGSARQIVVRTGRDRIDVRYMNVREAARLMGADDYRFNCSDTKAHYALGDAVCVPAIRWIERHTLRPRLN